MFLLVGGAVFAAGLIIVSLGWRRIHAAQSTGTLVTEGPDGLVRHPQYSGLLLMIVGALIQWPTLLTVVMAPILAVTYVGLARREERALREVFRVVYRCYVEQTPAFLPRTTRLVPLRR